MKNDKAIARRTDPAGNFPGFRRLNTFMDDVFNSLWYNNSWETKVFEDIQPKASLPKLNVSETDEKYEVEISAAGFNKEDIELEVRDNTLFIKCEHNEEKTDSDKNYLMKEISQRSFKRVLRFPKKIDAEAITCEYQNGIVHMDVGKKVAVKEEDGIKLIIN